MGAWVIRPETQELRVIAQVIGEQLLQYSAENPWVRRFRGSFAPALQHQERRRASMRTDTSVNSPGRVARAGGAAVPPAVARFLPMLIPSVEHLMGNGARWLDSTSPSLTLIPSGSPAELLEFAQARKANPALRAELGKLLEAHFAERKIHFEVFSEPGDDFSLFIRGKPASFFASIPADTFLPLLLPDIESLVKEGAQEIGFFHPEGILLGPSGSTPAILEFAQARKANPAVRAELGKLLEAHFAAKGIHIEVFSKPDDNFGLYLRGKALSPPGSVFPDAYED